MDYNELYQKANDVFTKYRTANMETLFQDSDVYTVKDSLLVSHEKRNSNLENAILTLSFLKDEEKKYELCLNSNIRESILILDDDLILSATTKSQRRTGTWLLRFHIDKTESHVVSDYGQSGCQ